MTCSHKKPIIVIGIDPGTSLTGYGILSYTHAKQTALDFGCIRPPAQSSPPEKYRIIFESIELLLDKYQPDALAVETQFVYKNVQSAIKLGMARGMAILAAAKRNIPVHEYAPKKAKLAVVGHGSASKQQVQKMIQLLLCLPHLPEPEDAADALALAICHCHTFTTPLIRKEALS
jgi:crossover junction endodeoxyribonuclease RuvC